MENNCIEEGRVRAYIANVEEALSSISSKSIGKEVEKVVELAKSYLFDAKYYLDKGDLSTALACIAYAEGLLDALNHMGLVGIKWKPLTQLLKRPKVLVAGAFEILHPGHIYLLKKAWELGEVYVVVARDKNFKRFKRRDPVIPEEQRKKIVESVKYVSHAVLGDEEDIYKPIEEISPDIVLLGPDQHVDPEELRKELERRGVRGVRVDKLSERVGDKLYSVSGIIDRIVEKYCRD